VIICTNVSCELHEPLKTNRIHRWSAQDVRAHAVEAKTSLRNELLQTVECGAEVVGKGLVSTSLEKKPLRIMQ
jgi:hypothetical protein